MEHKAEELKGQAKEFVGDKTDNESLQAQGAREEASGKVKQVGDDLKQAWEDSKDATGR
jgi:uncharacterized protein YjbJ (UPF0337 family)